MPPMPDDPTRPCPVCGQPCPRPFPAEAVYRCSDCSHWFSTFVPRINDLGAASLDTDIALKVSLREARARTYTASLDLLDDRRPLRGLRHLDVGCSIGQFLGISEGRGAEVVGIEPEHAFAEMARQRGHDVATGYFPEALADADPFDLISFMDVIGHIPTLRETGRDALGRLGENGYLMIKTPTADGLMFRSGRASRAFGLELLWQRLWQRDFASPQLHFFTSRSMERFAQEIGGVVVARRRFPALERNGLWQRLSATPSMARWKAIFAYCLLCLLLPLINALPQDSLLVLIQARGRDLGDRG